MRLISSLLGRYKPNPPLKSEIPKWSKVYANLPESYILRRSRKLIKKSPAAAGSASATFLELTPRPVSAMMRPWSAEFEMEHDFRKKSRGVCVQPIKEDDWMWFKGDRVEITRGKDKGKQGYIKFVVQERNWVCVEGLNCEYKTMGAEPGFPGIMFKEEKPLLVTEEIKLVDPMSELMTEVEWRYTEEGERVRVSAESGHIIPIPSEAYETIDYKTPKGYSENKAKDTLPKDVEEITYAPKLCTFEMDIMESMGIKEDRIPKKTWWY